jgi:hypothetical protein
MNAAPQAYRVKLHESFFGLFGGPIAWFLQLCAGYALASGPCFRGGERLAAPVPALQWTLLAMLLSMAAAVVIALLSLLVSWRAYRRTKDEVPRARRICWKRARGGRGSFHCGACCSAASLQWRPR